MSVCFEINQPSENALAIKIRDKILDKIKDCKTEEELQETLLSIFNENDERLWVVIKTPWTEYLYDITTHFLVHCFNDEYEWFSLLDWNYTDYEINYHIASNKKQYEL